VGRDFLKRYTLSELSERHPALCSLLALVTDSSIYLLGAAFLGAGNFILIPLYTRYLRPSEFGVYTLVDLALLFAVAISTLRLEVAYLKWFGEPKDSAAQELLSTVLAGSGLCGAAAGVVLWCVLGSATGLRWLPSENHHFVPLLLPLVLLENLQVILLSNLRAQRRATAYSSSAAVRLLIIVLASLYFVAVSRQGVTGIFLGRLAGDLGAVVLLLFFCRDMIKLRFRGALLRPMLSFSVPLIWTGFAVMLMDGSGRYFLSKYSSMEQIGMYGAAVKICAIFPMLITQPFGIAWGGALFQIVKMEDARETYSRILGYVFLGSLTIALVLSAFAPTLATLFTTKAYAAAIPIIPLIFLVRAVSILEYPASTGIYLRGRTGWFAAIYSAGLVVTFTLCRILVPVYGMQGAAWSWLAGWAAIAALMLAISQKYYPLRLDLKFFALPAACWVLLLAGQQGYLGTILQFSWTAKISLAVGITLGGLAICVRDLRNIGREAAAE